MKSIMKKTTAVFVAFMIAVLGLFAASASAATPLRLNWKTASIGINESYALRTNQPASTSVTWSSSNTAVATINQNGQVTGKTTGQTIISASINGSQVSCAVTVKNAPERVSARAATVEAGKNARIRATIPRDTASKTLTYRSSNTRVARVSANGTVTGVSAGSSTITVTTYNGKSVQTQVTVTQSQNSEKTLVAYFSMPETAQASNMTQEEANSTVVIDGKVLGNTQYVAQIIQETTGGDIFRIEPATPYTTDHRALVELATAEQNSKARPKLLKNVENLDDYDVIYLGYPIWWSDMPMIMYTFLESNDFSGKTIIPFSTHGGSGLASTISAITSLAPNATVVQNGFTVSRNDVDNSKDDVVAWVKSMN